MFEEEGEETVDTQPGDLVLLLRQKPHPVYRRAGGLMRRTLVWS